MKEKVPVAAPKLISKNTTVENLLKKYKNSEEPPKTSKVCVKEELFVIQIPEEENELKVSVKSHENDEPEMEAEYLLEEFQNSSQNEICVKEEMIEFDDTVMEDDDDMELISPILQHKSEQIKTKLKPSTKSCSK